MAPRLALAMTTARRAERYAHESLESMRAAGFDQELHVFAEPDSHDLSVHAGTVIHNNSEQLGCYRNWRASLEWMLANVPADWYMLVQDDVVYRRDTASLMLTTIADKQFAKVGFLSPYASAGMVSGVIKNKKGWQHAVHGAGRGFWGALTFCMPRSSAVALVANERFRSHNHHRKLDNLVGNVFADLRRSRLIHLPSFCDHIGKVSTLGRHKVKGIAYGRKGYQYKQVDG